MQTSNASLKRKPRWVKIQLYRTKYLENWSKYYQLLDMFVLAFILCFQGFYTDSKCNWFISSRKFIKSVSLYNGSEGFQSKCAQQSEPKLKLNRSDVMTLRVNLVSYHRLEKWGIKVSNSTLLSKSKIYWKNKQLDLV